MLPVFDRDFTICLPICFHVAIFWLGNVFENGLFMTNYWLWAPLNQFGRTVQFSIRYFRACNKCENYIVRRFGRNLLQRVTE